MSSALSSGASWPLRSSLVMASANCASQYRSSTLLPERSSAWASATRREASRFSRGED
ncbi:Uncharacterised protein [Bordetella pertussis]|nr:Uncharacterised protein [Bordetella pertussis]